jgi:ankyrin repeat protein
MRAISGVRDCVERRRSIEGHAVGWCTADGPSCCNSQANVEAVNNYGMTALMWSALNGHEDCLRGLLAAKVRNTNTCPQMRSLLDGVRMSRDRASELRAHSSSVAR